MPPAPPPPPPPSPVPPGSYPASGYPTPPTYPPAGAPVPGPGGGGGGSNCLLKSCLVILAVGVVMVLLVAGMMVFGLFRLRDALTSDHPLQVRIYPATDQQYAALRARLAQSQETTRQGRSATLELSADDLNTLVAKEPSYRDARGRLYFSVEDNLLSAEVSYPLAGTHLPGLEKRWLNGRVGLDVNYADHTPHVRLTSLEINGNRFPESSLVSFSDSFDREFQRGLERGAQDQGRGGTAALRRLESVDIENNRIVIKIAPSAPTPGGDGPADGAPTPPPPAGRRLAPTPVAGGPDRR